MKPTTPAVSDAREALPRLREARARSSSTPQRLAFVRPVLVAGALAVVLLGLVACRSRSPRTRGQTRASSPPPVRAFYHWRTEWRPTPPALDALHTVGATRLYVRFFDVDWDAPTGSARPVAPLVASAPFPPEVSVVPVVFLANAVFQHTAGPAVDALADHVLEKVRAIAAETHVTASEIQVDCDWSDSSRRSYFRFVNRLHEALAPTHTTLSTTLRLHQIKYPARTGVPPADRGMVMFYNFGHLRADADRSSIFNVDDASRYASYLGAYALPLDLSLPIFSWLVHSRGGQVLGLLEKVDADEVAAFDGFAATSDAGSPRRFEARRAFFFRGRYFNAGDVLAVEETTQEASRQAAELASSGLGDTRRFGAVAWFDLDERNLVHHAPRDLAALTSELF